MKWIKTYRPLIVVLAILIVLLVMFIYFRYNINPAFLLTGLWIICLILVLWIGIRTISTLLNNKLPWDRYLSLRFFVQLVSVLIYTLICFNLTYMIFKFSFTSDPPTPDQVAIVNAYGSLLVLPAFSIYYVVYFINEWKKSQLKSEKLEKETLRSQFENLKNHLDPHFLFNNLNILSTLIERDTQLSKDYLSRFAEVYRFMLQTHKSELITLRKEIDFITAYFHLIKVRFQDALNMEISIGEMQMDYCLPPMTLQMLVENAIKHNMYTRKKPLLLKIKYREDGYLIICNNTSNNIIAEKSIGSGLNNIKERYKYFTDKQVEIRHNEQEFVVEVPLINVDGV